MEQRVLRVEDLPPAPLDAASAFHARYLPAARALRDEGNSIVLVFSPAGHEHRAWRLAAVQELAREAAPKRVNAIAGDDDTAVRAAIDYLAAAPGITGQLLAVDGKSGELG